MPDLCLLAAAGGVAVKRKRAVVSGDLCFQIDAYTTMGERRLCEAAILAYNSAPPHWLRGRVGGAFHSKSHIRLKAQPGHLELRGL